MKEALVKHFAGRWRAAWWPWLWGGVVIAAFFGKLASSRVVLALRDVPLFHLPLRHALRHLVLAEGGLPVWNPLLNGGQPILSNPNYAAFYPLTWLTLPLAPVAALNLLILVHAAVGLAGAWCLARHLGCRPAAAAVAAVAFLGCGAVVSAADIFTLFCGLAWWPWALLWGERALAGEAGAARRRAVVLCALALVLQLFAGEPVAVLLSVLPLGALALEQLWRRHPGALLRLAAALALAGLLAAVQIAPTWLRLQETARAEGTFSAEAAEWSMAPARLVELLWPHFYGDVNRQEHGLYLGWTVHDRDFPYLASIYPGLLVGLLGLCALLRWPVPHRAAWGLAILGGLVLALGRHNPLFFALHEHVPVLGAVRFPEKFLLASLLCLGLVAALGWEHLLRERTAGRLRPAELPLVLAVLALVASAGWWLVLVAAPGLSERFVVSHSWPEPSAELLGTVMAYLKREAGLAMLWAALATAVLAGLRWRRCSPALLSAAAALCLAADLWCYGHGFIRVIPAAELTTPPPVVASLSEQPGRLFSDLELAPQRQLYLRQPGAAELVRLRQSIARLEPYLGVLWGFAYVGNGDYDLMLTRWGRHTLAQLRQDWPRDRGLAQRLLGAWGADHLVLQRPVTDMLRDRLRGQEQIPAVTIATNPYLLPSFRPVPAVQLYPGLAAAQEAARRERYPLPWTEFCVAPEGSPVMADAPVRREYPGRPRLLELAEGASRVVARYRSDAETFFVLARTFDPGWQAEVDSAPVTVLATAAGQLGFAAPAGEHQVSVRYRQPGLAPAATVSLLALAGVVLGLFWPRRSRPA